MIAVERISPAPVGRPESVLPPPRERAAETAAETRSMRPPVIDRVALTPEEELKRDQKLVQEELERRAREKKERDAVLSAILDPTKPTIPTESMGKCVTIAGRMMRGESVTPVDEEYLSGNAPQLYRQAVLMRQTATEDEGHGEILSEEDLLHGQAAMAMQALRPELRRLFSMLSEEETAAFTPPQTD